MYARVDVGIYVFKPFETEDFRKCANAHHLRGSELVAGLISQRAAIDNETDAPKTSGRKHPIE